MKSPLPPQAKMEHIIEIGCEQNCHKVWTNWVKIRSKNFFRLKFINFNHFRSIPAKKNFSKKFHRFRSCVAPSLSCDKSGIVKRPKLAHFPPDPSQIWTEILFLLHLSDEEEKFGNFQNFGLILAKFGFLNKVHNVSNP